MKVDRSCFSVPDNWCLEVGSSSKKERPCRAVVGEIIIHPVVFSCLCLYECYCISSRSRLVLLDSISTQWLCVIACLVYWIVLLTVVVCDILWLRVYTVVHCISTSSRTSHLVKFPLLDIFVSISVSYFG